MLIPLRSLRDGKRRLESQLSGDERAQLIERMAERVLHAAHDLDVLVVHDDPAVAAWAIERGADEVRPPMPGLNRAVAFGCDVLRERDYERVIIAHADLPLAEDLRVVLVDSPISIVTDRHREGTNVLCLDLELDFTFAYGPQSFDNHMRFAEALGVDPVVVQADDLALDVDVPEDLAQSSGTDD